MYVGQLVPRVAQPVDEYSYVTVRTRTFTVSLHPAPPFTNIECTPYGVIPHEIPQNRRHPVHNLVVRSELRRYGGMYLVLWFGCGTIAHSTTKVRIMHYALQQVRAQPATPSLSGIPAPCLCLSRRSVICGVHFVVHFPARPMTSALGRPTSGSTLVHPDPYRPIPTHTHPFVQFGTYSLWILHPPTATSHSIHPPNAPPNSSLLNFTNPITVSRAPLF